ncbi:pilus assembly protein TadG [Altererythrobacter sp. FM1]|uniref:Tad domain-containing protein n=1 Tax=Tsuneonella flava TaxID=2055955 RepID=UPI000C7FDDF8|nr:Tad domain-containing protein [Tsuneonella flava]ROT94249.1 pilus assembly protein TadG [Altererythrobacter sp. FM1]
MTTRIKRTRTITSNQSGSLLPIGALGLLILAGLIGGGVDMSRAYKAQTRLQAACDAGVLAGRKAVMTKGFDDFAKDEAKAYFQNNFNSAEQDAVGTVFTSKSDDDGNTIEGVASTNISSVIMQIFGFKTLAVSVSCSASMGVGNSDVTMVLDSTGSMDNRIGWGGDKKIDMLRDAMKNFYDTVQKSVSGSNARVRYAFVPYSSSINVGHLLYDKNPNWLVDDYWVQSRKPQYERIFDHWGDPVFSNQTGESSEIIDSTQYYSSTEHKNRNDCKASLPADTNWQNSGGTTTNTDPPSVNSAGQLVTTTTTAQKQTRKSYTCEERTSGAWWWTKKYYVAVVLNYSRYLYDHVYKIQDPVYVDGPNQVGWTYQRLKYDVRDYKAFKTVTTKTGEGYRGKAVDVSSKWEGCIEERKTVPASEFGFEKSIGITPSDALDLNIDAVPDPSDDNTRWAPMWPEVAYRRTVKEDSNTPTSADVSSYGQPQKPYYTYCPYKSQLLKTMSKSDFYDYADSLIAEGSTYHDLGILWGARVSSPQGIFADTVNESPANGGNVSRHMIFMTDGAMVPNVDIQSAYGIEYLDRRVTGHDGNSVLTARHTSRFLTLCQAVKAKGIRLWVIAFSTGLTNDLSNCASDNSAFTANDADELNHAFQEIAKQVGELRVTQ